MTERVGGVLVQRAGQLEFVPEHVLRRIVPRPVVSRVPGTELGLALIAGRVVSVISVAPDDRTDGVLLLCTVGDEVVALSGLGVVFSGLFESDSGVVSWEGQRVPTLDVGALVANVTDELRHRRMESLRRWL